MVETSSTELQSLTADIVAAYVSNNKVGGEELGKLIGDTYRALSSAGTPTPAEPEEAKPDKAAIRKSQHNDYLVSFIDGKHYKSLKRHLSTNGTTPEEYRARFGLPKEYPMVAPSYSAQRSELARALGLGRRSAETSKPSQEPPAAAEPEALAAGVTPKARRGKAKLNA